VLISYDYAPVEIFGPFHADLNPAVSIPPSSIYDVFGPLAVHVTGIVYDTESDWSRFSGQLRHARGVIRLAHRNTAQTMGLANLVVNYRFGQRQDLVSDVGNLNAGTTFTIGTGVLAFTDEGIQSYSNTSNLAPTSNSLGAMLLGGSSDTFTVVQSDATPNPPGQLLATTFSFWARFRPDQDNETIFGWDFKHWSGPGVQDQEWKCHAYMNAKTLHVDLLQQATTTVSIQAAADMAPWIMDGTLHHVTIYVYEYGTNQHRAMIIVDGLYAGGGENTASAPVQLGTNAASGGASLYRPALLGLAVAGQQNPGAAGWGGFSVTNPWSEPLDEFAISRGDVALDTGGHRYTSTPFTAGDRVYPPQVRHLSPSQVGYANAGFELVGPVEDTGELSPTGVNGARALILGVPTIYDRGLSDPDMSEVFFDRFYSFDNFFAPKDAINNEPVTVIDGLSIGNGKHTLGLALYGTGAMRQDVIAAEQGSFIFWINRSAAGNNIAGSGTASASSTAYGGFASNAISGKDDLTLSSTEVPVAESFHSDVEDQPWWQLDLGHTTGINSLILFAREHYAARLSDFYVLTSEAPFPAGNLESVLASEGVWSTFHAGEVVFTGERIGIFRPARYIRVWASKRGWLNFAECRVFEDNLAPNTADATIACLAYDDPEANAPVAIVLRTTGLVDVAYKDLDGFPRTISSRAALEKGWQHIALTWGPSGTILYVNGQAVDTNINPMLGDWATLWVGEACVKASQRARVSLDEIGYARQELTPRQVRWFADGGYFHDSPSGLPPTYQDLVQIATRASNSSFSATDTTLPWSNWYTLAPGRAIRVGTRGSGRYVQSKVRMYPSGDDRAVSCPGLDRLELYLTEDAPKQDTGALFPCKLRIGDYANFSCRMQVNLPAPISGSFPCRIKIVRPGIGGIFPAKLAVKSFKRFPAKLFVPVRASFSCKLTIGHPQVSKTFGCRVQIAAKPKGSATFPAAAYVLQHGKASFGCRVSINRHTWGCRMSVFSRSSLSKPCRLVVSQEVPGAVPFIKSNIPSKLWSTANEALFWWGDAPFVKHPVVRYFYTLTSFSNATASLGWDSTPGNRILLPASTGKWFFTIAAQNDQGVMSATATYEIWINRTPSEPGTTYMRINGFDTLRDRPVVARHPVTFHVLSWSASTDTDTADANAITYTVEIATRQDFNSDPRTGVTSIVKTYENLPGASQNWSDIPEPGIYFWRIRSSDGKQSSKWSSVGTFQVNAPPTRPGGLAAVQR
jgi:hypothetical protein